MKGCCPRCGFSAGMEAFVSDAEWKIAVAAAGALPSDCGPMVIRYIGCFAPEKRGLNSNRAAKLIGELRDMIVDGITFDRKEIKAPSRVWAQAIQAVLDSPTIRLPLKDHNYLLRIVESKLAQRSDSYHSERHQSRRGEARMNNDGMTRVADVLDVSDPELPPIPVDLEDEWHTKARDALIGEGFNPRFIPLPVVDAKARELYAEEVNHAGN